MNVLKVTMAVACEYVASGQANKHTLVNLYGGDILVLELPAAFPLAFFFEVIPGFVKPTDVRFEVQVGRKTIAAVEAELPTPVAPSKSLAFALPPFPVVVERDTEVRVVAKAEGYRNVVLISKTISLGKMPD